MTNTSFSNVEFYDLMKFQANNLPFRHTPTQHFINAVSGGADMYCMGLTITGYCHGSLITCLEENVDGLFFKAGTTVESKERINEEYRILEQLQNYDFVPRIKYFKEIGPYHILFLEKIEGISLDSISMADPRWKFGINTTLDMLHKLYREKGFLHLDMNPSNIMIDSNNKIYLLDFECSHLSPNSIPDKSWIKDLIIFVNSIDLDLDSEIKMDEELRLLDKSKSLDSELYRVKIDVFKELISLC